MKQEYRPYQYGFPMPFLFALLAIIFLFGGKFFFKLLLLAFIFKFVAFRGRGKWHTGRMGKGYSERFRGRYGHHREWIDDDYDDWREVEPKRKRGSQSDDIEYYV